MFGKHAQIVLVLFIFIVYNIVAAVSRVLLRNFIKMESVKRSIVKEPVLSAKEYTLCIIGNFV